jgi:16S rRNA (guanine527-N7)-methyltransferase
MTPSESHDEAPLFPGGPLDDDSLDPALGHAGGDEDEDDEGPGIIDEELEDIAAEDEDAPEATEQAKSADDDDDAEPGLGPDAPIPTEEEMRAALTWAFEGEDAPPELLDGFLRHAMLLLDGNRITNLTAITDPNEVAAKHFLDCWRSTRLLPLLGKRVLDLGSGGGFPGIPLALAEPHAKVYLCESSGKKAGFLRETVEALGLPNLEVVHDRAEEWLARNRVDVVILRAISSVRENVRLLRKVRHSLHDLVMLKGPSWSREVRAGEREAERLGFHLDTVWEHELPAEMGKRAVLVYRAPGGQGM